MGTENGGRSPSEADWDKWATTVKNIPPLLDSRTDLILDEDRKDVASGPASLRLIDRADMDTWVNMLDRAHGYMQGIVDRGEDEYGIADNQVDDIEAAIVQRGRWKGWFIVAGEFHNEENHQVPTVALDLVVGETGKYWPRDGDLNVRVRTRRQRGWPLFGNSGEDLELALRMAELRWRAADTGEVGPDTYLAYWEGFLARHSGTWELGDFLLPGYLVSTRTGPNKKFRPEYERGGKYPLLRGASRGRRNRSRHVEMASYTENVDDQLQGHAERHAYSRSPILCDVFTHGDATSLRLKTAKYRRAVANFWACLVTAVIVYGIDISGMDKSWSVEDQDAVIAAEAKHYPFGLYYRGPRWRKHRLSQNIYAPPIAQMTKSGEVARGTIYHRRGYNASGVGTTDTDNNKLLLSCVIEAVAEIEGWEVRKAWRLLGSAWMVFIKGDDTLLIVRPGFPTERFHEILARYGRKATAEGAMFLATDVINGTARPDRDLIAGWNSEWFSPLADEAVTPLGDSMRRNATRGGVGDQQIQNVLRGHELWWRSDEDLTIAAHQAGKDIEAAAQQSQLGQETMGGLLSIVEGWARGDIDTMFAILRRFGISEETIRRQFTTLPSSGSTAGSEAAVAAAVASAIQRKLHNKARAK